MATIDRDEGAFPQDILNALLDSLRPSPDEALVAKTRSALVERVRRDKIASAAATASGLLTVRASEGTWTDLAPGVRSKVLYDDGTWRTWLARMEAEARLPAHVHDDTEECLVLEGSVVFGTQEIGIGDYQAALAGSCHHGVYSRTGCLMLVRSRTPRAEETAGA